VLNTEHHGKRRGESMDEDAIRKAVSFLDDGGVVYDLGIQDRQGNTLRITSEDFAEVQRRLMGWGFAEWAATDMHPPAGACPSCAGTDGDHFSWCGEEEPVINLCPKCGHRLNVDHLDWHDCPHCGWKETGPTDFKQAIPTGTTVTRYHVPLPDGGFHETIVYSSARRVAESHGVPWESVTVKKLKVFVVKEP
jgi:hypothetical protein